MDFPIDHDLHIHTYLSDCSSDPLQTVDALIAYAKKNGLRDICVTDHFWDERVPGASPWYQKQNFAHVCRNLPLPQAEGVRVHFGCETELDKHMTLGISPERMDAFEFIIIPTTHMHMEGFVLDESDLSLPRRAVKWADRLRGVLEMPPPFHKIGIAHLNCYLIAYGSGMEDSLKVLDMIPDREDEDLFRRAAAVGVGIELNMEPELYTPAQFERSMRPFRIARDCGCKFYLGSDAHHPAALEAAHRRFLTMTEALQLTEADVFRPFGN